MAEKFGRFEVKSKEIADYHTQLIEVPVAIFKNALAAERPLRTSGGTTDRPPLVQFSVGCESQQQYVGMAKHDFYILDSEGSFALNFCKGVLGIWLRLAIVTGLAVTCSTYLSGVISWLTTAFIYIGGLFTDYAKTIVEGNSVGGGPLESIVRMANREAMVSALDMTPGRRLALGFDVAYRVVLRVFLNFLPDVDKLSWTDYVAEGFNIDFGEVFVLNLLVVIGYLLPCALVAYYLMKSREVAS